MPASDSDATPCTWQILRRMMGLRVARIPTFDDTTVRFIIFHHKKHPSTMGAPQITAFLSWLATTRRVSASTQNQALSAVLFLYRHVLRIEVDGIEQVPRARLPDRVPVVLSREEVDQIFTQLQGAMWLVAALLYGAGLRLQECLELRVKDLDFNRHEIVVRRGKGQKDRRTMLPRGMEERRQVHLREARRQHERDVADGVGRVVMPFAARFSPFIRDPPA